jgi:hypothetical protein
MGSPLKTWYYFKLISDTPSNRFFSFCFALGVSTNATSMIFSRHLFGIASYTSSRPTTDNIAI